MSDFELPDGLIEEVEATLSESDVPEVELATMIVSGGDRIYLPIARNEAGEIIPQTIMEAALAADLSIPSSSVFLLEGQTVNPLTTHIAPGMSISAVGNIKGG